MTQGPWIGVRGALGAACLLLAGCLQANPDWDAPLTMVATTGPATTGPPATTSTTSATTDPTTSPATTDPMTSETTDPTMPGTDSGDSSTGPPVDPVEITFGDRSDADVQGTGIDTYVWSANPFYNAGIHEDLHVDTGVGAALMRWDVSAIPADATISAAFVRMATWSGFSATLEVYEVLESWEEGTLNEEVGTPNWHDRADGVPWTSEGVGPGSRGDELLGFAESLVKSDVYVIELDPDLIQRWLDDPDNNFGFVIIGTGETSGWLVSRDYAIAATRPLLTVEYLPGS